MSWFLFIATLPGQAGSLRLRFWRQLKGAGAANLRDGVYLLPALETLRPDLLALCDELTAADGSAWLLNIPEQADDTEHAWRNLFDRHAEYQEWRTAMDALVGRLPELSESDARRQVRQARKDLDAIAAIDYFPGEALDGARRHLADAERRLTRQFSPDEPAASADEIARLNRADFQGRLWATRARLWVDRVASAWLIRRFIDPSARFLWLTDITQCPSDALGFDFDGAAFTHVGERVTFETLLASFALESAPGLARLGAMVHALDLGGEGTPESQGFEAILAGARQRHNDDDTLLNEVGLVLDSLYAYFQQSK